MMERPEHTRFKLQVDLRLRKEFARDTHGASLPGGAPIPPDAYWTRDSSNEQLSIGEELELGSLDFADAMRVMVELHDALDALRPEAIAERRQRNAERVAAEHDAQVAKLLASSAYGAVQTVGAKEAAPLVELDINSAYPDTLIKSAKALAEAHSLSWPQNACECCGALLVNGRCTSYDSEIAQRPITCFCPEGVQHSPAELCDCVPPAWFDPTKTFHCAAYPRQKPIMS